MQIERCDATIDNLAVARIGAVYISAKELNDTTILEALTGNAIQR
jgi:hypothetical protein